MPSHVDARRLMPGPESHHGPGPQAFRQFPYPTPPLPAGRDEIVEAVRAHHARQERLARIPAVPAAGYRAQSLNDMFGRSW